ncbi:FAD-dependent oxidoreductase [Enterococcus sp. CWB-B31]|uniref:FAD-dependent oxidoreductase n=1 Tax=Enterococcus sp. CWB-B31 TaxID=2885159 RepID=UPI001E48DDC9|nr:FAD-dependent oxidoreductase [Enterococcus sp. CWB-B31]MCB5956044.1 FAD-dependent oxidoreductase [Enterococcus sp. CWB-B31]
MKLKVVIIGASFAGIAAAFGVRKKFKRADIYIIDQQSEIGYLPGGLNLFAYHQIASLKEARFITESELQKENIQLMLQSKVIKLHTKNYALTYIKKGQEYLFSYDKLILATGSSQWSEKISGSSSKKVLKYKFFEDSCHSLPMLESSRKVSIIGGGQIGIEAIDSLLKMGKEVCVFESMDYLLFKYFDKEMIQPVYKEMLKRGVLFHFNEPIDKIESLENGLSIHTNKEEYFSDVAVFAMNVRPDLSYLDSKIKRHIDGTVLVDEYLRTSQKDVFAAGDCIQIAHSVLGESFYIPLVNNAVRTGLAVSQNLLVPTAEFIGSIRTIGTRAVGYYIASTGLTEEESLFYPQEVGSVHIKQRSSLFSGEEISGKLIFERATHRLLGAQLVSKDNILEKINTLALSIQVGQCLEEVYQKEYFFHPFYSSPLDITNLLGIKGVWEEQNES